MSNYLKEILVNNLLYSIVSFILFGLLFGTSEKYTNIQWFFIGMLIGWNLGIGACCLVIEEKEKNDKEN